jgi:hypothetical protein
MIFSGDPVHYRHDLFAMYNLRMKKALGKTTRCETFVFACYH